MKGLEDHTDRIRTNLSHSLTSSEFFRRRSEAVLPRQGLSLQPEHPALTRLGRALFASMIAGGLKEIWIADASKFEDTMSHLILFIFVGSLVRYAEAQSSSRVSSLPPSDVRVSP